MMTLRKYFLRGLLTFLPAALTVYILIMFVRWAEGWTSQTLTWFLNDAYVPGMGLALAVVVIVFLGFIVSQQVFKNALIYLELPFKNVPLIKSVYAAFKSLSEFFSGAGDKSNQQVVMVKIPNLDIEMVGFLTRKRYSDLPKGFQTEERVAVYFPMSYAVGGYTTFVPKSWIRTVDLPVEVAMRSALTAWMPGRANDVD